MAAAKAWVGQPLRRLEDATLLAGRGRYIEDLSRDGMLHVAIVRSPYPHARIMAIAADRARSAAGVVRVVTAEDLVGVGSVPAVLPGGRAAPEHPVLARSTVRFAGEPVAAVVADSRALAADAAELVEVEYEALPGVADALAATDSSAPRVHSEFLNNEAYRAHHSNGNVDEAFARAERRITVEVRHGRVAGMPIEPRGVLAWTDEPSGRLNVALGTQAAWIERTDLAAMFGMAESDLRVITPDVGGAFGAKMTAYREDALLAALARMMRRPVRWISTRAEDFQSSMHGRDAWSSGEVAFDTDGHILGLRVRTVVNLGAYLMKFGAGPALRMLYFPTGAYAIQNLDADVVGVWTNTPPTGPYRGAGRPEAAFFAERMADEVAHALGMDPAEVRRRNFIPPSAFPYRNAGGMSYDRGAYEAALDRALCQSEYAELRREQERRRARGEIYGIGIATTVEVSGGGGEFGEVRVRRDGSVEAFTGVSPHGQGHHTTFAQLVADELGVRPEHVTLAYGDTDDGPGGRGTMGSRSGTMGGNAVLGAAQEMRTWLVERAATLLEVAPADVVLWDGAARVQGVPSRELTFAEIVTQAAPERDVVSTQREFTSSAGDTYPFGTTIVAVAIDKETGRPSMERFVAVDDCGHVLNPVIVEGQLQGGIVEGLGEALLEEVVYDPEGQLQTGSLSDYAIARAAHLPTLELSRTETPSPRNPLGMKGVGESGTVSAPPAIANAILDALRPFGARGLPLPMTPQRLWQVIADDG
jgi:carbon-monoxide dehydrogenase large subunit